MVVAFCLRAARSRAAIASTGSPARGSGTDAAAAKPGVTGRLRAIGSLPGKLAQPETVRLSKVAAIGQRPA